ncbi:hypothetical protein [Hydrogenophilus thermoluteolus]|uniref:Lipopolysaccharide assembly protein LapB n=1 Tax=Hydrogenophilus thermoluteolus TaxID=297 RepID=A0A2Z6E0N5_HYDTE|nr:hypothetical protein [Hydrogenophilus thermoluteolus]BBD78085.1 lipopolysaccharide assembly protein LapB [Hydrogenophilus thermoluteolus]
MIWDQWWYALLIGALFFALGWIAGRIDLRAVTRAASQLPRAYLTGLNHLLHGRRDQALEALLAAAELHPGPVELQLALAALMRDRGEYERAIAIHRALAARSELTAQQRDEVIAELALDYHRAGFLDRAEAAYRQMLGGPRDGWARAALVAILQTERDWNQCLALLEAAPEALPHAQLLQMHLHCELAQEAISREDWATVAHHWRAACEAGGGQALRTLLVEGEWRLATQDEAGVRSVWERIERIHPDGLALVLDKWLSALPVEQWPTVLPVVRRWFQRFPQIDAWARYVDVELQCGSADEAFRRLQEAMRVSPDLMVLDAYLRLVVWMVPEGWRVEVDRVRSLVHGYVERLARYHCQKCGFKAKQHHWRCPACGEWGTFPPRRTVAFEGSRAQ